MILPDFDRILCNETVMFFIGPIRFELLMKFTSSAKVNAFLQLVFCLADCIFELELTKINFQVFKILRIAKCRKPSYVICQTRKRVFRHISKHREASLTNYEVLKKCHETRFRVLGNIFSMETKTTEKTEK